MHRMSELCVLSPPLESDHTMQTAKGYYLYIESSNFKPNQSAELVGPTVTTSQQAVCVTFWSHMYGDHIGTFNLYNGYTGGCFEFLNTLY